jgi:MFS family permease
VSLPLNPQQEYVPDPARWRILMVLLVTLFMSLVGVSIVNVALPSIQTGLGASQSDIQWVLSGYALTFGIVLVAAGRAGDIFGRGPLFLAGVVVFTLASVAAGFAPDPVSLNVARFVQGIGSGLLNPQAVGMIQQYFRGAERGRAFGLFGSTVGLSVAIGPLLGGLLIEFAGVQDGWRWTFIVNVPVGILAIVLGLLWFPRPLRNHAADPPGPPDPSARGAPAVPPDPAAPADPPRRRNGDLDPMGAVLLGLAVMALLLPFMEARSRPWVWLLLPAGLALAAVWIAWENRYKRRGRSPMVDLAIFRIPSFTNGTILSAVYFTGMTSIWVLIALYMQAGLGHSALEAGLIGLPGAVLSVFSSHWSGKAVMQYGRRVVIAGILCAMGGLAVSILVIQLQAAGAVSVWWLLPTLSLVGMAQGMVISPNQTLTLAEVPLDYAGSSGGIVQTGQRLGTSMGIAMITALAFAVLSGSDWSAAITAGFAVIGLVMVLTLAVAIRDQRQRQAHRDRWA